MYRFALQRVNGLYLNDAEFYSKGLRDNKDALTGLANHSCNLINSVVLVQQNFQRDGRELAPGMVSNLEDFVKCVCHSRPVPVLIS